MIDDRERKVLDLIDANQREVIDFLRELLAFKTITPDAQRIEHDEFIRHQAFMKRVRDLGLHEKAYFLVGVGPLRSERAAEFIRSNVPGVHIPDEVIERLRKTPKQRKREEGKKICVEIIQQVREIEGVHGGHLMAYRQEELVAEIVEDAGLMSRRRISEKADTNGWRSSRRGSARSEKQAARRPPDGDD